MTAPLAQQDAARDIDPNVLQRRASNPETSVWVSASAGTGKTKVLTDRVLRLLLPRENGTPGSPAHKILCLTFTKAGANEMSLRIAKTLGKWAVLKEEKLRAELDALFGRPPNKMEFAAARKLFAQVVDVPGGLKITTIHSFCKSVLGRFPLEARINPNFKELDESQSRELITQSQREVFTNLGKDRTNPLEQSVERLGELLNEDQFASILKNIISERTQLQAALKTTFDISGFYTTLCEMLQIEPNLKPEDIIQNACTDTAFAKSDLAHAAQIMGAYGTQTDQDRANIIAAFIAAPESQRPDLIDSYKSAFITQKETVLARLCVKAVSNHDPKIPDIISQEAERLLHIIERIKRIKIAQHTRDIITVATDILDRYDALKMQQNALDFDDLILKTLALLQQRGSWVHYKLDQGLDHILVDEAQDTNPEQWKIIDALCDDFFDGEGAKENTRTLFVVGDEKQSIYSFQRASPEEFIRRKREFKTRINSSGGQWQEIDLNISFRSTPSVLQSVDAVFAQAHVQRGVSESGITHIPYFKRAGQEGRVEIWPLTQTEKAEPQSIWEPPITVYGQKNASQDLADNIAAKIKLWIDSKEMLSSHSRPIEAGDIMILVQTRKAFVEQVIRALKTNNIPVSGADRMVLGTQIAVQDLLSALKFIALPEDDLNLACLLKSPMIGMDEETLFDLAYNREGSLWKSCQAKAHIDITAYLKTLLSMGYNEKPFEILKTILDTKCPANHKSAAAAINTRLGKDSNDPINEMLRLALNFEREATPTLQHFIQRFEKGESEIKREGEQSGGLVRIMTVHGSKGLQAPIVILPDTIATAKSAPSRADKRLLWPNQTGLKLPLWSPGKPSDAQIFQDALERISTHHDAEYRRLLYVAMTRAEDRLYICGHKGPSDAPEECWYNLIKTALGDAPITNPKTREADRIPKETDLPARDTTTPDWLFKPAEKEENLAAAISPSRMEETAASPIDGLDTKRFLRGNLTHKLLQLLPDLPNDIWEAKAKTYLAHYGRDLSEDIQNQITGETLKILGDNTFSEIFGPGSLAEVPITGFLSDEKTPISGQIDRLLVKGDEILIIDYKTNRPPPLDPTAIPQIYIRQMRAYADILRQIYPGRVIKCALLWTDGPNLMPLDPKTV